LLRYESTGGGGQPGKIDPALKVYFERQEKLTAVAGCFVWCSGCFPLKIVLEKLHAGNPGIVRIKSLAHFHV